MHIRKPIIRKFGTTKGCKGCNAIIRNDSKSIGHDERCRDRIMIKIGESGTDAERERMMQELERQDDKQDDADVELEAEEG